MKEEERRKEGRNEGRKGYLSVSSSRVIGIVTQS
jgi:hypothetical protein